MNMVKVAEMVADILVSLVLGNRHHCSGSEVTEGSGGLWRVEGLCAPQAAESERAPPRGAVPLRYPVKTRVATTRRPADSHGPPPTTRNPPSEEGGAEPGLARRQGRDFAAGGAAGQPGWALGLGLGDWIRWIFAPDRPKFLLGPKGDFFFSLFLSSNDQEKSRVWLETKWAAELKVCGQLGSHASFAKRPLVWQSNLRGERLSVVRSWAPRA